MSSTTDTLIDPAASAAPLSVLPAEPGAGWISAHRAEILDRVAESGAVLLRGTGAAVPADVAGAAAALGIEPMAEREGFAPRAAHAGNVYSASQWPADEQMCMHHEGSYGAVVPGLVMFGCLTAPATGGRTNVADSQQVLRALPAELVAPFERDGWVLTRMYHEIGVAWTEAFGTDDRARVDAYCRESGLTAEWLPDNRLRTVQRRAAVLRHPRTGVPGWFNQIAFLNGLTLDPVVREYLVSMYGPGGLPFDTAYGDGSPIAAETVEAINEVYNRFTVGEAWRDGDILVLDNIRMAHAREPYTGSREIVTVFGDPVRLDGHVLDGLADPEARP